MSELILFKSREDVMREQIQDMAEHCKEVLQEVANEVERKKIVIQAQAEMTEGEKITTIKKGDDINKVIDTIEWRAEHCPDRKLISIPGLVSLKGGLY